MAQIKLSGNLTKDPQFFDNENSASAVRFTVAENVDKDTQYAKTFYHSVSVRGAKAKAVSAALSKGDLVRVSGRLESYTKTDVKDTNGYDVVFWVVTAFDIEVYDRDAKGFKVVIKSEPRGESKGAKSEASDDEPADEGKTKPKAAAKGKSSAPVDDGDDF